nr:hypothetical protein [Sphingomonas vulcanisoli]
MSGPLADAIGLIGSAVFIAGYLYSNIAKTIDFRLFNAINLLGALLLIVSLLVHFNLASMVLEIAWGLIAAFGLIKALRGGKPA